jgi:hypothetical protein
MQRARNHQGVRCRAWSAAALLMLLLAGCNAQKQPVYENRQRFRFVPPPGWVERARDDAMPARAGHRQQNLPLPPLGVPGHQSECFLVRYDRISTAHHAWLRVTVADLPSSTPLKACLSTCLPDRGWKRESEEDGLEVSGLPAARIAFVGRCYDQDYLCETFAVRKGEKVYLFSAAFPASDDTAREQLRHAVLQSSWQS